MDTMDRIGYLLKRGQAALRYTMDAALEQSDLTMARYATLTALAEHTGERPLTNADLASLAFVTPQTMSRLLRDLERDGLVTRRGDPENRRRIRVELTRSGKDALQLGHESVDHVHSRLLEGLSTAEVEQLRDLLLRMAENLEE